MRSCVLLSVGLLGCRPPAIVDSPPVPAPMTEAPEPTPAQPPADRDADGVPEPEDRCPDEPEDRDQFEDGDGCADRDNDGDGVLDAFEFNDGRWTNCDYRRENGVDVDCRNMPEDFDNIADHDGCPDVVTMDQCQLRLSDRLALDRQGHFAGNAGKVLDQVAAIMVSAPEIKLSVEAHVDRQRDRRAARHISERAAQAALEALVSRGIARERLEAIGWSDHQPIEANTTPAGRARNRRVEFKLRDGCNRKVPFQDPDTPQTHECR